MTRTHVTAGILGALATIVVAMPLSRLFDESTWLAPAIVGVLVIALSGMLARRFTLGPLLVFGSQLLAGAGYLLVAKLSETTVYGVLPTPTTVTAFVGHMRQAYETVTTYAAPAPATPGVAVALVVIIMVVALAVDLSTATADSPTIAGLPLFSLFLVSASNSGGSLPWGWFVAGAVLWLMMVAHQSELDLRAWATAVPILSRAGRDGESSASSALTRQAAVLGAMALAAALVVPLLAPHLPTRYVLDGLGGGGGDGLGSGQGIRLSTELDLRRSLENPSTDPVLTYRTNDPSPQPLRVAVVTDFTDGFGRMRATDLVPKAGFEPEDPMARISTSIPRDQRSMEVSENKVAAPQLALPDRTRRVSTDGVPWALGPDGTARVESSPSSYAVSSTELDLTPEHFGQGDPDRPVDEDARDERYLRLDPGSASRISSLARELVPREADPLTAAQTFQEYLRSPEFTYDLDIPDPPNGPDDPILSFLETKVGYCQQFAATMTLLARADGIPARTVVGFLPGTEEEGEWTIQAKDAHAWPELYFEGVGWVRFEPTPGARAADVPDYSITTSDVEAGPEETTSTTTTPTPTPTESEEPTTAAPTDAAAQDEGTGVWVWWLLGLVVLALVLALMPASAWLARRRAESAATDEADRVEREWQDLISRLGDLGVVPPVGATPRQTGAWLARRTSLGEDSRHDLDKVVVTLESARYAPPGRELPDVSDEVDAVVGGVRSTRMRSAQLRALLWPSAGVEAWRALGRRLLRPLRRR